MNTGAPTFNPSRFGRQQMSTFMYEYQQHKPKRKPGAQIIAYTQIVRTIVPPVLRITGRNFSTGKMMNFSLAKNFKKQGSDHREGCQ